MITLEEFKYWYSFSEKDTTMSNLRDKLTTEEWEAIENAPDHYDNSKGSIYKFCFEQNLNSYEFDIIKRIVRCRKKGQFKEDLEKTKFLIDLYLKEYEK